MKKAFWFLGFLAFLSSCSQVGNRLLPYPEGIVFPVEQMNGIAYEGEITGEIFQKGELFFFSTWDGGIHCLESTTGNIRWIFQLERPLTAPLSLSDEFLYAADQTNTVHCLDLHGRRLWEKGVESPITGPTARIGEVVCFGTQAGQLVALNRADGEELWRFSTGGAIRSNPVEWEKDIVFGSDDHFLYVVDENGSLVTRYEMDESIGPSLSSDNGFVYFGSDNGFVNKFDIHRGLVRWKVRTGGPLSNPPSVHNNRVYFVTKNNVLYCVNGTSGSILWWKSIPARVPYRLLMVEDRIVVSSLSNSLICLDGPTGIILGQAEVKGEMKSNPLWIQPLLLVSVFDKLEGREEVAILKKQIKIGLQASVESPQELNTEIVFSAEAVGFHQPRFEFYVSRNGIRTTVQESSEKNRWAWFPEEPGSHSIGVKVQDERLEAETEIPFVVTRPQPQVTMSSSLPSPRTIGDRIVFSAVSKGFSEPEYYLQIFRLLLIPFGSGGYLLYEEKELGDSVLKSPQTGSWTWTPESEGTFLIRIVASGGEKQAQTSRYFLILKEIN